MILFLYAIGRFIFRRLYNFFSQADKVNIYWNNTGAHALLLTSTEVDKTGASYYGKQTLHYLSTKGETAMLVFS